jgi:hypothetical protein
MSSMFACVHDTGGFEPPSAPSQMPPPPEKGTLDRIVEEAEKLRRKCKSLRNLLLETETRRKNEKDFYEAEITAVKDDLETRLSELQTNSHIEVCEMRDFKSNELLQAKHQLDVARNEVSMQGVSTTYDVYSIRTRCTALILTPNSHLFSAFSSAHAHRAAPDHRSDAQDHISGGTAAGLSEASVECSGVGAC